MYFKSFISFITSYSLVPLSYSTLFYIFFVYCIISLAVHLFFILIFPINWEFYQIILIFIFLLLFLDFFFQLYIPTRKTFHSIPINLSIWLSFTGQFKELFMVYLTMESKEIENEIKYKIYYIIWDLQLILM